MNLLGTKYTTCAKELLEQVIGAGWRVDEIRFILEIMRFELDNRINALTLGPVKKNLPEEIAIFHAAFSISSVSSISFKIAR